MKSTCYRNGIRPDPAEFSEVPACLLVLPTRNSGRALSSAKLSNKNNTLSPRNVGRDCTGQAL
jgi:hypothetical protein